MLWHCLLSSISLPPCSIPWNTISIPSIIKFPWSSHSKHLPFQSYHSLCVRLCTHILDNQITLMFSLKTTSTTLHPIPNTIEPTSYYQELKDLKWRKAMDHEFNALIRNGTWELVPKVSQHPIGCKWVFLIKRNSDVTTEKYKTRLEAKVFLQAFGKDYFGTLCPITILVTICTIICIALS